MSLFEQIMNEDLDNEKTLDEEFDELFDEAFDSAIRIPEINTQEALKISSKTKSVDFVPEKLIAEGMDFEDDGIVNLFAEDCDGCDDDDDEDDDDLLNEGEICLVEDLGKSFEELLSEEIFYDVLFTEGTDEHGNYIKKLNIAEVQKRFGPKVERTVAKLKKKGKQPLTNLNAQQKEMVERFAVSIARKAAGITSREYTILGNQKINKYFRGIQYFKISGYQCFCVNTNRGFTRFMYLPVINKGGKSMQYYSVNLITLLNKKYTDPEDQKKKK